MDPEYYFHYFLCHTIILVPLLSHFIFFLHIEKQNIFLDKNPATPPPPLPRSPDNQMVSPA